VCAALFISFHIFFHEDKLFKLLSWLILKFRWYRHTVLGHLYIKMVVNFRAVELVIKHRPIMCQRLLNVYLAKKVSKLTICNHVIRYVVTVYPVCKHYIMMRNLRQWTYQSKSTNTSVISCNHKSSPSFHNSQKRQCLLRQLPSPADRNPVYRYIRSKGGRVEPSYFGRMLVERLFMYFNGFSG